MITQAKISTHAEILISAQGILETPNIPRIPGLSKFKGDLFHSARWREDIPLEGKKVGVIGNGASAFVLVSLGSLLSSLNYRR